MSDLSVLKEKVQRILTANWRVELTEDGFFVRGESTGCHIRCIESEDGDWTYVNFYSFVLLDVPITDEFLRYVAGTYMTFGSFVVVFSESGDRGNLIFDHTILGNYLDSEELNVALGAVFWTADEIDDDLQQRFGGQRAIDGHE